MRHGGFSLIVIIGLFLTGVVSGWAQNAPSQVTVSIQTQGGTWVGQKVTLVIDLLAPGYFSGVPRFDFPQIPGVLLVPPEEHPVLSTKEINGQSFTDQRYEVSLFAKTPGVHEIPPFKIRFGINRSPFDQGPTSQEVTTPSVNFSARLPPGAEKLKSLISADDLVVESKWNPIPHACKVGDAFTRTITYSATDVPGMAFPPFPAQKVEGFNVYSGTPVVSDRSDRGQFQGNRTDTITYVCKEAGNYVVPAVQITWWNIRNKTLQAIKFPAQNFAVARNPQIVFQTQPKRGPLIRCLEWMGISISLLTVLTFIWRTASVYTFLKIFGFLRSVHLKKLNP